MSMRMDDDSLSMTSNAGSAIIRKRTYQGEAPVSTFTDFFFQGSKRLSPESTSVCASNKRKGVVLQQNGHWGAQIYANHNRIWLGTFNSEKEAAMAYDSAAIKLRNGECHMNFGWTVETDREFHFQSFYSQEEILSMIKDRSYQSRLESFWEAKTAERWRNIIAMPQQTRRDPSKKQLFQKELKPSDVSKLNRLVIPKSYATKYFPRIDENAQGGLKDNPAPDVQLSFFDETMRPWKFRYCYWKSSQSFVFTKGWNRFVKERLLKANDTIRFFECHTMEGDKAARIFYMIEVDKAENSHGIVDNASQSVSLSLTSFNEKKFEDERDHLKSQTAEVIDVTPEVNEDSRRLRLFGVNIHVDED